MQKAWQAWTCGLRQKMCGQDGSAGVGGGALRRSAPAWVLAQFGREVFCP